MNEDRGTRFQRLKRRGLVLEAAWTVCVLGGLLTTGAGRSLTVRLDTTAASLGVPDSAVPLAVAASFVLVLVFLCQVGLLPLTFRRDYVLDRRYGLTAVRPGAWLRDHLKGQVAAGATAVVAAVVVVVLQRAWPTSWWAPAWGGFAAASVIAARVMPVWVLPRFSRMAPLDRATLVARLEGMTKAAGMPVVGVYAWHHGGHTRRINARLAGVGAHRRILLSDPLLAAYTDDEIEVIVAHELAHDANQDVWKGLAAKVAVAGLALWLGHQTLTRLAAPLGLRGIADPAGVPLLALVAGATLVLLAPLTHALSRHLERQADRMALDVTANPDAFVRAIKRLSADNLADEDPPVLSRLLFYSHPPVAERLEFASRWRARYLADTTSSPRIPRHDSSVVKSQ